MDHEPPHINPETHDSKAEKSLDELQLALDVKQGVELNLDKNARYIIADIEAPKTPEEMHLVSNDATLGFEVVTTDTLPTEVISVKGKNVTAYVFNGMYISANIKALFVDRSQPAVDAQGQAVQNFKGMRADEQITPDVIAKRFGKEVPFSVSLTSEGTLSVVNSDETKHVSVLGFGNAEHVSSTAEPVDDFERAVAAARAATDIEESIYARTENMVHNLEAEVGESLTDEEIREIGEEGLVAAEVEAPIETPPEDDIEADERSRHMHGIYEQSVLNIRIETAQDVARFVSRLEESEQSIAGAEHMIAQTARQSLERFNSVVRRIDDYPVRALQTEMKQTIDDLYKVAGTAQRFGEMTLSDIHRGVKALQHTLEEYTHEAEMRDRDFTAAASEENIDIKGDTILASDILHEASGEVKNTKELNDSLNILDRVLSEVTHQALRLQIKRLEEVLHASYTNQVNPGELANISNAIQEGLEGEDLKTALKGADASLNGFIARARRALVVLTPR